MQDATPPSPRLHRRWDRLGRLVGDEGMQRLHASHVMVIGLGGVGSFAAEALARSGVGHLTFVDFDLVCVTNTNRQLQAVRGTVGKPKASVLADRARSINPDATIRAVPLFYEARIADQLLGDDVDVVVDAIDNLTAKCDLLARCHTRGLPVVCATGAAGRMDPTRIGVADLAATTIDPLAASVRKILRRTYGFPKSGSFGIPAVFSTEPPRPPRPLLYDGDDGLSCVCPNGDNTHHTCDDRHVVWGNAAFVTGAMGLSAASVAVRLILSESL